MRYDENNNLKSDFVLNKKPYSSSKILIAGKISDVDHLVSMLLGRF